MLAQRDENTKKKSKKIAETAQILMTVDNLYQKCHQRKDLCLATMTKEHEAILNFDQSQKSAEKSSVQLENIISFVTNFRKLKLEYLAKKAEQMEKAAGEKGEKKKQAQIKFQ